MDLICNLKVTMQIWKPIFFRENAKDLCISFHGKGRTILLGGEQYKEKHKISGHPRLWAEQPEVPGLLL